MYDCEDVISNDANINRIYDKYVQEQMIRALDNATEYQDIVDKLKAGQPLLSNQIETLKDSLEDYFPEGFDRDQIQHVMKELYFIINSDDSYIPNLMEEYVLANCIDTMQDTINMDESLLIQMPQRDDRRYRKRPSDRRRDTRGSRFLQPFDSMIKQTMACRDTCYY